MKRLAIIGAGVLGYRIAHYALTDKHYQPIGFFDDFKDSSNLYYGLPILGTTKDIQRIFDHGSFDLLMIGLGYQHFNLRADLFNQYKDNIPFGTIVHSTAYVDKTCTINSGVFILPGCVLDMNVHIDHNVLLSNGCVISHDSKVGQHSFLSTSVSLAGFVTIGQKVFLGIGTSVIDNIKIADKTRTGGGAVIIDNIISPGLYVGIPAVLKKAY